MKKLILTSFIVLSLIIIPTKKAHAGLFSNLISGYIGDQIGKDTGKEQGRAAQKTDDAAYINNLLDQIKTLQNSLNQCLTKTTIRLKNKK